MTTRHTERRPRIASRPKGAADGLTETTERSGGTAAPTMIGTRASDFPLAQSASAGSLGRLDAALLQLRAAVGAAGQAADPVGTALEGVRRGGTRLPHAERIQESFGRHDVSGIQASMDGAATQASEALGARAYAVGERVAFAGTPDLHTAAHEAAHVIQQRGGVQLKGGMGQVGDRYEQHADAVADAVVAGRSAEALLDRMASRPASATARQGVQLRADDKTTDAAVWFPKGYEFFVGAPEKRQRHTLPVRAPFVPTGTGKSIKGLGDLLEMRTTPGFSPSLIGWFVQNPDDRSTSSKPTKCRTHTRNPAPVQLPAGTTYYHLVRKGCDPKHPEAGVLPDTLWLGETGRVDNVSGLGEVIELRTMSGTPSIVAYFPSRVVAAQRELKARENGAHLVNRWVCLKHAGQLAVEDAKGKRTNLHFSQKYWVSAVDTSGAKPRLYISQVQKLGGAVRPVSYSTEEPTSKLAPLHRPDKLMELRYFQAYPYERWTVTRGGWSGWHRSRKRLREHPPEAKITPAALQALGLNGADWLGGKVGMTGKTAKNASKLVKHLGELHTLSNLPQKGAPLLQSLVQNEVKALLELRLNIPVVPTNNPVASGHLMLALLMEVERSKGAGGMSEWKAKVDVRAGVLGKLGVAVLNAFIRIFGAGTIEVKGDSPLEMFMFLVLGIRKVASEAGAPGWMRSIILPDLVKQSTEQMIDKDGSDYIKLGVGVGGAAGAKAGVVDGQASYRRNRTKTWSKGKDGKMKTERGGDSTFAAKLVVGDWGAEVKIVKSGKGFNSELTLKEVEFTLERSLDLAVGWDRTTQLLASAGSVLAETLKGYEFAKVLPLALIAQKGRAVAAQAVATIRSKYASVVASLRKPGGAKGLPQQPLEIAVKAVGKYDARGKALELAIVNAASLKVSGSGASRKSFGGDSSKNDLFYAALELEHTLAKATFGLASPKRPAAQTKKGK